MVWIFRHRELITDFVAQVQTQRFSDEEQSTNPIDGLFSYVLLYGLSRGRLSRMPIRDPVTEESIFPRGKDLLEYLCNWRTSDTPGESRRKLCDRLISLVDQVITETGQKAVAEEFSGMGRRH